MVAATGAGARSQTSTTAVPHHNRLLLTVVDLAEDLGEDLAEDLAVSAVITDNF